MMRSRATSRETSYQLRENISPHLCLICMNPTMNSIILIYMVSSGEYHKGNKEKEGMRPSLTHEGNNP